MNFPYYRNTIYLIIIIIIAIMWKTHTTKNMEVPAHF